MRGRLKLAAGVAVIAGFLSWSLWIQDRQPNPPPTDTRSILVVTSVSPGP